MLGQCCASVANNGPTFSQHWFNVPSLLKEQYHQPHIVLTSAAAKQSGIATADL